MFGSRPEAIQNVHTQRERRLKSHGFLVVQPNPFVDEVGIEAVVQGDGGAGLGALLDDLGFEKFAVGTALRVHGKSA